MTQTIERRQQAGRRRTMASASRPETLHVEQHGQRHPRSAQCHADHGCSSATT
ncbi:hypothetical protein [Streptomyces sp. NPDC001975]